MDAVLIDTIERNIIIVQSKFERKGNETQLSEAPVKLLGNVREYFRNQKSLDASLHKANDRTKKLANQAFELKKKDGYNLQLVLITTHKHAPQMDDLITDSLNCKTGELVVYDYPRIMSLLADRERDYLPILEPFNLEYVDADKNIVRTVNPKSWVVSVNTDEIRSLGTKYGKKLFKKNIRDSLGTHSKINKGIQKTLNESSGDFWYFNNGITILCDQANLVPESHYVRIVNPQVINGCQTVWSITNYQKETKAQVLVRIVEGTDHDFIANITRYQNTSNPVEKRDFKSSDPIQVRLKREFKRLGWYYEIKRGEGYDEMAKDRPSIKKDYPYEQINNGDTAKVLAAVRVGPDIAAGKGNDYFFDDENYDDLFSTKISTTDCIAPYLLYWDLIKESYRGKKRFHSFKKAYIFKNPASYHVLAFMDRALSNSDSKNWNHRFMTFWENINYEDAEWRNFSTGMSKNAAKYFEVIHSSWESRWKREGLDYNSFLQGSDSANIRREHKGIIRNLDNECRKIFNMYC